MKYLVIGVGNSFRRDDGVGLAVADEIARLALPDVEVMTAIGEPGAILDAWSGVPSTIVIDAAVGDGASPGRIRRWAPGDATMSAVTSHALGLPATYALGQVLGRIPDELIVLTVDVTEVGYGDGLTSQIAAAVPRVVSRVLSAIGR